MSHARWVVIAEDCYRDLTNVVPEAAKEAAPVENREEVASVVEEPVKEEPVKEEPVEEEQSPEKKVEEAIETPENVQTIEIEKTRTNLDWISSLPPSYQKEGQEFLRKLTESPGFSISSGGIVEIEGVPLDNYSITDLLRTACIPFNKSTIPLRLQDWLRETGITTFRNHLLKILPKWQNRYSWRVSTMAGRKVASGVQRPSTRKRKS